MTAQPAKKTADAEWQAVAEEAVKLVESEMTLGLGTGRAASAFVRALAARVEKEHLEIFGVPTSEATRNLAEKLDVPLTTLDAAGALDLTVDGADQVAPNVDLIKGLGGAHVREKIVAAASRRLVVVTGEEKLVEKLGGAHPVPVEVLPFGLTFCRRRLAKLGCEARLRPRKDDKDAPFVTDNGNYIVDCQFPSVEDPTGLDRKMLEIPGVVGTGLFVDMAERVLVQRADGSVDILKNPRKGD